MNKKAAVITAKSNNYLEWVVALAVILFLVVIGRWVIFESDLFLQIRAGQEIVQTGHVQTKDTWSFTAQGQPWFNAQWISTVVDYYVSLLSPHTYSAFHYWRSLLMFISFLLQAIIIFSFSQGPARIANLLLILPWTFFILLSRFQMRPDLYVMIFYQLLIWLWVSDQSLKLKKILGLVLLLLWSNFHGGTVPFGILFYGAAVFFSEGKFVEKLLWMTGGLATWFATPLGFNILNVIRDNFINYDYIKMRNVDFVPFSLKLMKEEWIYSLWPPFCLVAFCSYIWLTLKKKVALPKPYRHRLFAIPLIIFLSYMALDKLRTVHYQVFFLLPLFVAGLSSFLNKIKSRKTQIGVVSILCLILWGLLIPKFITETKGMHEPRVADWVLPVGSVEFIKRAGLTGNILNDQNFGGYVVAELPQNPVARDSRCLPFIKFEDAYNKVYPIPEKFKTFIENYSVNIVLDAYPRPVLDRRNNTYTDMDKILYPSAQWALVYFDSVSIVLLRRTPAQENVIQQNEYHLLRPGTPITETLKGERVAIEKEVNRCLGENPRNTYCLSVKSAF